MAVLFVDSPRSKPYNDASLQSGGIGGTEATILRVSKNFNSLICQPNRDVSDGKFLGKDAEIATSNVSVVVTLRSPVSALKSTNRFPSAKHYLWLHDLAISGSDLAAEIASCAAALAARNVTIICVSNFHKQHICEVIGPRIASKLQIVRIYNPVVIPPLRSGVRNLDDLIFASAPYKGLNLAIRAFRVIKASFPSMRLLVANPGYGPQTSNLNEPGVVNLGSLSHSTLLQLVSECLCAFLPNFSVPETFGLVLAEANAVGTPVLTHSKGAAPEILSPDQMIPFPFPSVYCDKSLEIIFGCSHRRSRALGRFGMYASYVEVVQRWRKHGPPSVSMKTEFSIENVIGQWRSLFALDDVPE